MQDTRAPYDFQVLRQ